MTLAYQASLLDVASSSGAEIGDLSRARRTVLTHGAWIDVLPGWVQGSDEVFLEMARVVLWREERRQMYDRVVDVPRLLSWYGEGAALPHPVLERALASLNARYGPELGEPFCTAGLCYYRDGRDSVAWHGDTIGRGFSADTMVAIVSFGAARRLTLRPRDGRAPTVGHPLGHGDLIVMGGSCQRTWEHAILKTSRPIGPRISVQFRPHNVR